MSAGRSGRLGVGIIGAGRVGPILGAALAGAGHAVVGIAAISEASRERAEAILPGVPMLTVTEVVERSELVLIAVPESELAGLISGLAALGAWQSGQLVVHTAPGIGVSVFAPALGQGVIPLAIHPAMAFTGTSIDLIRLREARCAVTAPAAVLPIAQALVIEMGAEPVVIAETDRSAYAEAITSAGAFSSAIVEQAARQLAAIGVQAPGSLLGGVIRSAVENALMAAGTVDIAQHETPEGPE